MGCVQCVSVSALIVPLAMWCVWMVFECVDGRVSGWCLSEWMLFELAGRCLNTLYGNCTVFKRDGRCLSEFDGI